MSEVVGPYEAAKLALAEEAAAIVAQSPAYRDSDSVGPHGAVHLTMEALWQKPELIEPLAMFFRKLAEMRAQVPPPDRLTDEQKESLDQRNLLHLAFAALSAIQRLGYSLNDDYPLEATVAYEKIGRYLYPDIGLDLRPVESAPHDQT